MPSIAVVIAAFNGSDHLEEALQSVLGQQRLPDEVLLVDDGSTDDTPAIAHRFGVRVLRNQHAAEVAPHTGPGPAGGRMTGLHAATSDLVALLDQDDIMLPEHLRLTEQAFLDHPEVELCFGDATEFGGGAPEKSLFAGKRIGTLPYRELPGGLRLLKEPLLHSLAVEGSYIPTAANLWRRKTAIEIGGFEPKAGTCDDLHFFMRLGRSGAVAYYPFAIARKRNHGQNLSHPRHALRQAWSAHEAYRMILSEDQRWRLEPFETQAIREHMMELERQILYHASLQGVRAYWRAMRLLAARPKGFGRSMARAVAASLKPR